MAQILGGKVGNYWESRLIKVVNSGVTVGNCKKPGNPSIKP
jgi:hypothetical protein